MCLPAPGEKPLAKITILDNDTKPKRARVLWPKEKEGMSVSGTRTWWMDGWRTDAGIVRAAVVCVNGDGWTGFGSYLGMERMDEFDAELRAIRVAHQKSVAQAEPLRAHRVTTVVVCSDLQAATRWMAHLDPGPGQQLARAINEAARTVHAQGIDLVINWVLGHSGIPGNDEADHKAKQAREGRGITVHEHIYISAAIRARRIVEA